jgi:hypothetical protein
MYLCMQLVYRVTLVNTLDKISFTQLMAIAVGVTAYRVLMPLDQAPTGITRSLTRLELKSLEYSFIDSSYRRGK